MIKITDSIIQTKITGGIYNIFLSFIALALVVIPSGFASASLLTGAYDGTVHITQPNELGLIDISFTMNDQAGVLSGDIITDRVLVLKYKDGNGDYVAPTFTGTVDYAAGACAIDFIPFSQTISGKTVTRQIQLECKPIQEPDPETPDQIITSPGIDNYGEILRGEYTETITGLLDIPIIVKGTFTVNRDKTTEEGIDLNQDCVTSLEELRVLGKDPAAIEQAEVYVGLKRFYETVKGETNCPTVSLETINNVIKEYQGN